MPDKIAFKIPVLDGLANAGSYKAIPFDFDDPRGKEPLVKLSDYGLAGESFYARTDGNNAPYYEKIDGATEQVWARKTVAEKLVRVNALLRPHGVEIFVFDAYRPVQCQRGLWDFFDRQAKEKLPSASEEERKNYILTFVSDPTQFNPSKANTWPVHACGGAVDLTLRDIKTKTLRDMGAGFDEMSNASFSDTFERKAIAGEIGKDDPRLNNRRLLHWGMTQEGFVNYGFEFWHFDYGDQMHVLHSEMLGLPDRPSKAWYGYIASPEL
jgi:D-alanyl-D-alanine dipeptidase